MTDFNVTFSEFSNMSLAQDISLSEMGHFVLHVTSKYLIMVNQKPPQIVSEWILAAFYILSSTHLSFLCTVP